MFNVIYRWTVKEGKEEQFESAWREMTHLIRAHRGGLGSRLHRCDDGSFVAYAQWPDRETWAKSSSIELPANEAGAKMKEAIASAEPAIKMDLVCDLLV